MDSVRTAGDEGGGEALAGPTDPAGAPGESLVGETLGPYQISALLGEGGMGRVYLAQHKVIGRKAAIKILNAEIAENDEVVSRFFNEARAVNDIRHPNIVEVTDLGTHASQPYIVMEYLEGDTLGERIDRVKVLDEATAARIAGQIASALAAAHERGLVHRDLKPANIFLRNHPDYPDFVKLLDFGIAKLLGGPDGKGLQHRTQVGAVLGTPAYMSPEQCLGDARLDHRSDIYSLGVVLYLMVTGRLPFEADTLGRLILLHVNEAPRPPILVNPRVSSAMNTVVLRALEKRPERRFATMREMREALSLLGPPDRSFTPPPLVVNPQAGRTLMRGAPVPPVRPGPVPAVVQFADPTLMPVSAPGSRARGEGIGAMPTMLPGAMEPPPRTPPPAADAWRGRPGLAAGTPAPLPEPTTPGAAPAGLGAMSGTLGGVSASPEVFAERLREIIHHKICTGSLDLPALSPRILRCLDLVHSSTFSFTGVAAILGEEPRLASQLLQTANGAAFLGRSPAARIEQAIGRLGAQGVRAALLEHALRPVVEAKAIKRLEGVYRKPWHHALAVALVAQKLAQALDKETLAADAYVAGLFLDAGRPIVAGLLVDVERQLISMRSRRFLTDELWLMVIDANHALAGAALVRHWQLGDRIAYAVETAGTLDGEHLHGLPNLVRVAGALATLDGFALRQDEQVRARETVADARRTMRLDDAVLARATHGVRDLVIRH